MALFVSPFAQYTDASGNPGSGYKLYFYTTGTTTPITIYSDSLFATLTANPAIADSAGQWDAIYVNTASYKVVMKSAADVTIRTADPVSGNPASGPASSTDNAVVRFDGTTGKALQNSGVIIDDSNNVTGIAGLTATTVTGTTSVASDTGGIGVFGNSTNGGSLRFRPNGVGSGTGQASLSTAGNFTIAGDFAGVAGIFSGAVSGTTGTFTGIVTAAVGAVGAPSYTFTGDSNTGIYRSAADVLDFTVGGTQKGSFFANGFAVSVSPGLLIDPTGSTAGVSLSAVGAYASYLQTVGASMQLGQNNSTFTAINFIRVATSVGTIACSAGATAYNTSSDKNLKEDWHEFDAGVILDALEVWKFKWKEHGTVGYGVLAQDAYEVFPQAITKPSEDEQIETWSADYSKYVPLLLAEIKSLRKRLDAAGL